MIAAGAWSGTVEGLPRPVAVAPVRGQMAALPWPDGARRAIVYGHGCYIAGPGRRGDRRLDDGVRRLPARGDLGRTRARLQRDHGALSHAHARASVKRTWAGLRPVTPDGLPIIGAEPRLPGLWYATGHGRNGILLAGITGADRAPARRRASRRSRTSRPSRRPGSGRGDVDTGVAGYRTAEVSRAVERTCTPCRPIAGDAELPSRRDLSPVVASRPLAHAGCPPPSCPSPTPAYAADRTPDSSHTATNPIRAPPAVPGLHTWSVPQRTNAQEKERHDHQTGPPPAVGSPRAPRSRSAAPPRSRSRGPPTTRTRPSWS